MHDEVTAGLKVPHVAILEYIDAVHLISNESAELVLDIALYVI
jgi:hypothetical protein